jgi:signal transduction histidine kinase
MTLLLAQMRLPGSPAEWFLAGLTFVAAVITVAYLASFALRQTLNRAGQASPVDEFAPKVPSPADPAFAAASMQAVIQRLKEQEKELERLHRAEKERAQQTERLSEAVTRNMPTGLLLIGATGLITIANPAARQVLGIEALGYRRYGEALGEDSPLTALLARSLASADTFQREELNHVTPSGAVRRLGVTISPVFHPPGDPHAKVSGAVCLLTDLTEMTELQRQMRLKENLAALGEMAAGIAHEFKNALATISGYAQMIRSEAQKPELAENAQKIIQQTQALSHVVTEFLRFSRPLDVTLGEVDVRALLSRVAEEAATAMPGVDFQVTGHFEVCPGDEGLLRQAFLNLARNAGEAANAQSPPGQVRIAGEISGQRQRVAFEDNGSGIPEADLSKIFLPFYTTKADGTGLGLALVQKIVLHHGGTVEARNRPGGGAEFIVWLPRPSPAGRAIESLPGRI